MIKWLDHLSYGERLESLGLTNLEKKMTYKIIHGV